MTKKNELLRILSILAPYWHMAAGFSVLINSKYGTDIFVDKVIDLLSKASKEIKNTHANILLRKSLKKLKATAKKELLSQQKDESDAEALVQAL